MEDRDMPPKKKTYSDDEAINYILALENPTKEGWDPKKKIWTTPKRPGFDKNQIAGGLDIRQENNPEVYNFLKSHGRLNNPWLTDSEAKQLMMRTYAKKQDSIRKAIELAGGNVSQRGYNILQGMAWHGHPMKSLLSADSVTGKAFRLAIANGDLDFDQVFDTYYNYGSNKKLFAERIKADAKYRPQTNVHDDGNKVMTFPKPDWTKGEKRIPEVPFEVLQDNTVYPPAVATPLYINMYNNPDSPSYGGTTPRIKGIQEYMNDLRNELNRVLPDTVVTGNKPSPFALPTLIDMMNDGKEKWVRNITGMPSLYDELQAGPTLNLFRIPILYANKGKDLPKFDGGEDLSYADSTWHENWLNGRKKQFDENVNASPTHKYLKLPSSTIEGQIEELKKYTEYDNLDDFKKNAPNYPFPENIDSKYTLGVTSTKDRVIGYNTPELNNPEDVDDNIESLKIHERTHALGSFLPQHRKIHRINLDTGVHEGDENGNFIYRNNPSEIYSGLMETRFRLGLTPDYEVKLEDIQKWRKEGKLGIYLQDKPDDALLRYFNEVASNPNPLFDPSNIHNAYGTTLARPVYANKGKDLPHLAKGKDSKQVERGGITYNVDPSAIGASELEVEVPNTTVRSTPGMLQARETRNENARRMAERFLAQHPFGANKPPIEPGLELISPEFDLLTLVGGVAGLGTRTTNNLIKNNLTKEVPDAISAAVSPRQAAAARRALSKRFDLEELTGSSIADDIAEYYGKNYNLYPTQVKNSIENSVYPRMREMRPWLTDNLFKSAFNYAADGKYTAYPAKTFLAANGPESRITASYYPNTDHIAVRAGRITDDLGHEIEHKLDEAFPLIKLEDDILSNAYKQIAKDERKTTNYEARKALLGPYADQNLSVLELNKIIDAAADEEIFEAVANSNGYGYDFMEMLRENDQLTVEIANAIRQAMKKVGAYSAPIVSGATLYNLMQQSGILSPTQTLVDGINSYNKGKDIYIKPSKRGTFTAAAKKHGKSVQAFASLVLANPGKYSTAMRKKALFARNASKWKH